MQTRTPTEELENRGAEQQYRINLKHHSESIEFQNSVQKLNESIPKGNSFKKFKSIQIKRATQAIPNQSQTA